MDGPVNVNKL